TKDRLQPRIRETAKILWFVYAGLTALLAALFLFGGMSLFDAANHALTTMPTGGYSTRNASMGAFTPFAQWAAIVFMYLGGINFALHYRALRSGARAYWHDGEWRPQSRAIPSASPLVAVPRTAPGAR